MIKKVNIIIPVYADWSSLKECIKSLKEFYSNNKDIEVYFCNDCGPEADSLERKINNSIKDSSRFHYYRNDKNLGFVKNCNNAVFYVVKDKKADILLLNSDTIVTRGFLEEMQKIQYSKDDIGIVSPRSNNATIWSVPMDGRFANNPKKSYEYWVKLKQVIPYKYITPTAHGFCMLIRREIIDKIGLFDEIYGIGYGEENDFTMRALYNGWKCATANDAFVFHYESRSFGKIQRSDRQKKNIKILRDRYPEYEKMIKRYIQSTAEPIIDKPSFLLKLSRLATHTLEYGNAFGYRKMLSKGFGAISRKIFKKKTTGKKPNIKIWSHEVSNTGAPLTLFSLLRQWKENGTLPKDTEYFTPMGTRVDGQLQTELSDEGFKFAEASPVEVQYNKGDIVIFNSTAFPIWLYDKTILALSNGIINHLYFYIHENDNKWISSLTGVEKGIEEFIKKDKITIYVPSSATADNWKKILNVNKNIYVMSGEIKHSEGTFSDKSEDDFNSIDFIIAGSCEPGKGQLNIVDAFSSFYHMCYKKNKKLYRNFSVKIAGMKNDDDLYNKFVENSSKGLDELISLYYQPTLEEMHELMRESNFTIMHSISETFSLTTMEGMAYGHPIIRSEAPGCKEQLEVGKNGWLAPTTSPQDLVDAIEQALNKKKTSNSKLLKMSDESSKIAKRNFTSKYKMISDIDKKLK